MKIPVGYELLNETPTIETYLNLRAVCGLSAFSEGAADIGLKGSHYAVVLKHDERTVGMGRIVGDGGCFFQIVDICVLPEHQKMGLGKVIMGALVAHLEHHAPARAYVSLLADVPADKLYEQFGFQPTGPKSIGMARRF